LKLYFIEINFLYISENYVRNIFESEHRKEVDPHFSNQLGIV